MSKNTLHSWVEEPCLFNQGCRLICCSVFFDVSLDSPFNLLLSSLKPNTIRLDYFVYNIIFSGFCAVSSYLFFISLSCLIYWISCCDIINYDDIIINNDDLRLLLFLQTIFYDTRFLGNNLLSNSWLLSFSFWWIFLMMILSCSTGLAAAKKMDFNFRRLSRHELRTAKHGMSSQELTNRASPESLTASTSSGSMLKCLVDNVFPAPEVVIYGVRKDGSRYQVSNTIKRLDNSVSVTALLDDDEVVKNYEEQDIQDSQHPFHYSQQYHHSIPGVVKSNSSKPYQFECIYSMDVNNGVKNYTRVSSMTYSPQSAKDAQISSLSSSSSSLSLMSSHLIFLSLRQAFKNLRLNWC